MTVPLPLLSAEEEIDLIFDYQALRRSEALEQLLVHFMPLIERHTRIILKRRPEMSRDEAASDVVFEFIRSVRAFNSTLGYRLASFFKGRMLRIKNRYLVPDTVINIRTKGSRTRHAAALCAAVDAGHLKPDEFGISETALVKRCQTTPGALEAVRRVLSPIPLDQADRMELIDLSLVESSDSIIQGAIVKRMREAFDVLSPRERAIIEQRFPASGRAKTRLEIGEDMSVSKARIGQIERRALLKLSMHITNQRICARVAFMEKNMSNVMAGSFEVRVAR